MLCVTKIKEVQIMFQSNLHHSDEIVTGENASKLKSEFEHEINRLVIVNDRNYSIIKAHFFRPKERVLDYPDYENVDLLVDVSFLIEKFENTKKVTLKKFKGDESWHRIPNTTF